MRSLFIIFSFFVSTQCFANEAMKHYEKGLTFLNQGDFSSAEIEVKNSLKLEKNYLPARMLLAEVLLQIGKFQAAEKEFELARSLQADSSAVVLPLVEVKLLLNKANQALSLLALYPQLQSQTRYFYLQGNAYKALRDFPKSLASYQKALIMKAKSPELYTAFADLWYQQEQVVNAQIEVKRALALQSDYIPALLLSSEIDKNLTNFSKANEKISIILDKNKHHKQALFAKAGILLAQGKLTQALAVVVLLRELTPDDPYAKLLHSTLIAQQGDTKQARRILMDIKQQLSGVDSLYKNDQQVLLLSATVDFISQNIHSAKNKFLRYIDLYDGNSSVYHYLAIISFRLHNLNKAQYYIEQAIAKNPNNADFYILASQIYQKLALTIEQLAVLEKARSNFPDNEDVTEHYISVLLTNSRFELALELLNDKNSSKNLQNKTLLAFMQLQSGLIPEAKVTAQALLDNYPDKVEVLQLAGELSLKTSSDTKEGVYFFEQALLLDENFSPAIFALAGVALQKNNLTKAEQYYQDILTHDENNPIALQLYADLAIKQNRLMLAIKLLKPLVNQHKYQTGRALLTLYIATKQTAQAEELLALLELEYPLDQALLLSKSRLQAQLKQFELAKKTLKILFGLVYEHTSKLTVLAHAQLDLNDIVSAQKTITRIEHIDSNSVEPYLQARLHLSLHEYALTQQLVNKHINDSVGNINWVELKVQLLIAQQQLDLATTVVEQLYHQEKKRKYVQLLAQLYANKAQDELIVKLLSSWLQHMPSDAWAVSQLSVVVNKQGNTDLAIKVLEEYPKLAVNPAFLNNLANYYLQKHSTNNGNPVYKSKALEYAKQAYALAPHSAAINDTLGWILVQFNQTNQGLALIREASARDINNGEIYYHLAYALATLDNYLQAETAFAQAIRLLPKHPLKVQIREMLPQ